VEDAASQPAIAGVVRKLRMMREGENRLFMQACTSELQKAYGGVAYDVYMKSRDAWCLGRPAVVQPSRRKQAISAG
jgi:hypothetical protein